MGIKDRVKRMDRGIKRCERCGYPGGPPQEMQVDIVMMPFTVDAEGKPHTEEPEPEYCSGCGRLLEPIRVRGIDSKPVSHDNVTER